MLKSALKRALGSIGFEIRRKTETLPRDLTPELVAIWKRCEPYTMTSLERMIALHDAVRYVEVNEIPGAFVECGVWRGGSSMNMALTLLGMGKAARDLYMFDTFAGMTPPTEIDVDARGRAAQTKFDQMADGDVNKWCYAPLEEVRANMRATSYPDERLHFIQGKVEETIPASAPEQIAILRLDTDWFESTQHELRHLLPRLAKGGVLLLDDYGHWRGARQAVDAYFEEQRIKPFLFRIDYTGRMMLNFHR